MKFGVFFKRVLPFILTLAIGLVVTSFFVALTFPSFKLGSERRSHVHECKRLKQEIRELRRENRRLNKKLEKPSRNFDVSELDRLVPAPPAPPAPPRPVFKEMRMTPMAATR
ncbi:MAG: hypothetical protein H0V76_02280 [Blastocatellia bacterium]|nr:hypothetical protein [Blastocatellia bacterium]